MMVCLEFLRREVGNLLFDDKQTRPGHPSTREAEQHVMHTHTGMSMASRAQLTYTAAE